MRKALLVYLLLIFVSDACAQGFVWARQFNLCNGNGIVDVAMDEYGNSYMTGAFIDSAQFDGFPTIHIESSDMYLVKINPRGEIEWVKTTSGDGAAGATAMAYDYNGNIYVIGIMAGTVYFGNSPITVDNGVPSHFLAKYDVNGNFLWVNSYPNEYSNNDSKIRLVDVACTPGGDVVVTGLLHNYNFGGTVLNPNNYSNQIFTSKLSEFGIVEWVKVVAGNAHPIVPYHVVTDNSGAVLIGCEWGINSGGQSAATGECDFDGNTIIAGYGQVNGLIAKYDTDGVFQWARKTSESIYDFLKGINVDTQGNVYVNRFAYSATSYPVNWNERYAWVEKYDASGQSIWSISGHNLTCNSSYTAPDGNSYLHIGNYYNSSGPYNFNGFAVDYGEGETAILKVDSSGTIQWVKYAEFGNTAMNMSGSGRGTVLLGRGHARYIGYYDLDRNYLYNGNNYFDYATLLNDTAYIPQGNNVISGNIYDDNDFNCSIDQSDQPLDRFSIVATPGPYYGTSDTLGNYTLIVDSGEYTITQIPIHSHQFTNSLNCPANNEYPVHFFSSDSLIENLDFANNYNSCPILVTEYQNYGGSMICDSIVPSRVHICNYGEAMVTDISAVIQYPSRMIPLSSSIPWVSYNPVDSLMVFDIGELAPDSCMEIFIWDSVTCYYPYGPYYPYEPPYEYSIRTTPLNSCYASDTMFNHASFSTDIFYDITIDVGEKDENRKLTIYPNPTTSTLRIQLPENNLKATRTSLYDISGRLVHQQPFNPNMDVGYLDSGTYIIVVETEEGNYRGTIEKY